METAIRAAPGDHATGDEYRLAAKQSRSPRRAIAFFEELVKQDGYTGFANLHFQLGMALAELIPDAMPVERGLMATRAARAFEKASTLDPRHWEAQYARGLVYLRTPSEYVRPSMAIEAFTELLARQQTLPAHDGFALTFVALGDAYAAARQPARAQEVWRQGLSQFPQSPQLKERLTLHDGQ